MLDDNDFTDWPAVSMAAAEADCMPPVAKAVSAVLAVAASVCSVVFAPSAVSAVFPEASVTVIAVIGIVFGAVSSILVVGGAVLACRVIRQTALARKRGGHGRSSSGSDGSGPPVVG